MSTADRIEQEKAAIQASQEMLDQLQAKRTAALLEDDERKLDAIENEQARTKLSLSRSKDRLERLEEQLRIEGEEAASAELDALTEQGNRLRAEGERLITKVYAPAAATISDALTKLAAIDNHLYSLNRRLEANGRAPVASPNAIRCTVARTVEGTEMRLVGIGEPIHPLHSVHTFDLNGNAIHRDTKEIIPKFTMMAAPITKRVLGRQPMNLADETKLPGIDPKSAQDYWPASSNHEHNAAVIADILQTKSVTSPVRSLLKRTA